MSDTATRPAAPEIFGHYWKSLITCGVPDELAQQIVLDAARRYHGGELLGAVDLHDLVVPEALA